VTAAPAHSVHVAAPRGPAHALGDDAAGLHPAGLRIHLALQILLI